MSVRPDYYHYRLQLFLCSAYYACVTVVLQHDVLLSLFLMDLLRIYDIIVIAKMLPYTKWHMNARAGIVELADMAHTTVLLNLQLQGSTSPYTITSIFLF